MTSRVISLLIACQCLVGAVLAQTKVEPTSAPSSKPNIQLSDLDRWPIVDQPNISNDGKYFSYAVQQLNGEGERQIYVQSLSGDWKTELSDVARAANGPLTGGQFSADSSQFLFRVGDQLCLLQLTTHHPGCISDVQSYRTTMGWLAYQVKANATTLILRRLKDGKESRFDDVAAYWLNDAGTMLLTQSTRAVGGAASTVLEEVVLRTMSQRTLWSAPVVADHKVTINLRLRKSSTSASPLAFCVTDTHLTQHTSAIWYLPVGAATAAIRVSGATKGVPAGFELVPVPVAPSISASGRYIAFDLVSSTVPATPAAERAKVDVWNYRDELIQETQLRSVNSDDSRTWLKGSIGIDAKNVVTLPYGLQDDAGPDLVVIPEPGCSGSTDKRWKCKTRSYNWASLADGVEHRIIGHGSVANDVYVSPTGRFLLFYDLQKRAYFAYQTDTGRMTSISAGTEAGLFELDDEPGSNSGNTYRSEKESNWAVPGAIWISNEDAVLVHDNFDLWKLDLRGVKPPVNITHGYGRAHSTVLRLLNEDGSGKSQISNAQTIVLMGYNRRNKQEGFFRKRGLAEGDPQLLSMAGGLSYNGGSIGGGYGDPIKARDAPVWIVIRQSATEAPNYFTTRDFRTYQRLTDVAPQRAYNWLTAQLIQWANLDGGVTDGIIYKPENFDPKKRYPVIINYYEVRSQHLYSFPYPQSVSDNINIPWFVSQGYVVVIPDIWAKLGEPGPGALSAVVSAAQYLSQFPWVNAKKIGIQGHSYGGYETNYLVTHSDLFAAACSASGFSNFESLYGSLWSDTGSSQDYVEGSQGRMGVSLWEDPDRYRRNSPVYALDKVKTPLLILANKGDDENFRQEVQVFMGLRRLDRRVWLLQYDDEGHSLFDLKNTMDFTLRLTQFFDYYLKDAPPPKWMTEGVPARLKGVETGLELDASGAVP